MNLLDLLVSYVHVLCQNISRMLQDDNVKDTLGQMHSHSCCCSTGHHCTLVIILAASLCTNNSETCNESGWGLDASFLLSLFSLSLAGLPRTANRQAAILMMINANVTVVHLRLFHSQLNRFMVHSLGNSRTSSALLLSSKVAAQTGS